MTYVFGRRHALKIWFCALLVVCLVLSGCSGKKEASGGLSQMESLNGALSEQAAANAADQGFYRSSYEIFVYSFADSDGDGIGDLKGVESQLGYIADEMGFSEIWLTPIFPSPTYHKYDATDYTDIDPAFGSLADFDALLSACHGKDVRLILDLAVNHTSSQHPWFAAAAQYLAALPAGADPVYEDCPYVWYYNFTREPYGGCEPLKNAGLSDGAGGVLGADSDWYYEARFWSGMPDLNLSTEAVREEIRSIASFWLGRGVDGFRLDALTSYYTDNAPASIDFTGWFTGVCKEIKSDAYLVGECWTDQSAYAKYYESGIDSLFDFAFSGDSGVIASVVKGSKDAQTFAEACASEEALYAASNPNYVNAPFYTNHDMARSVGYYAYDDGSHTKLAGALNLFQTGNSFVYYGEELGMKGSGKDENKRAPMFWVDASADAAIISAGSSDSSERADLSAILCAGPPDMGKVEHKFGSYAAQREDPASIWNYYRNAVLIRNAFPVIARGSTVPAADALLSTAKDSSSIGAFYRVSDEAGLQPVLILFNTSEEVQTLNLSSDTTSAGYTTLSAMLVVSDEAVTLKGTSLTLPPFSLAVLTMSE